MGIFLFDGGPRISSIDSHYLKYKTVACEETMLAEVNALVLIKRYSGRMFPDYLEYYISDIKEHCMILKFINGHSQGSPLVLKFINGHSRESPADILEVLAMMVIILLTKKGIKLIRLVDSFLIMMMVIDNILSKFNILFTHTAVRSFWDYFCCV